MVKRQIIDFFPKRGAKARADPGGSPPPAAAGRRKNFADLFFDPYHQKNKIAQMVTSPPSGMFYHN